MMFLALFIFNGVSRSQTPEDEPISVKTDLIQTNVTVTDKNNRFVDGLTKDQFELRVDGKTMPVEFFEQVVSAQKAENKSAQNNNQKPVEEAANTILSDRKIIFFVDDLHLSFDSLSRTREAISHFIEKEMLPRDNVLIVSASGRIGFLQQFTDHQTVLRAALERLKYSPTVVRDTEQPPMPESIALRIVNGDAEAAQFYVEEIFKGFNSKQSNTMNQRGAMEMVRNRAGFIVGGMTSVSETSLGSLESLLQTTNQIPGRKIIFFASDGFYLGSKNTGMTDNVRLQSVINSATRSGSVIYTIDARGLFNFLPDATGERPFDRKGRIERGRIGEEQLSQEALFTLAEQTGGEFLKNQNYFDKWIDRTLDNNSNYYLLGWSPENDLPTDKKFKRIEVGIVGRPELTVRLQRGYLANSGKADSKNAENSASKNKAGKNTAETVTKTNNLSSKNILPVILSLNYLDVPNVGGVLTNSVQVSTEGLDFSNNQAAAIDVAGVVFNDQGKQVADFKTGLNIASRPQNSEQSVIYNQRTPLAPGVYQVRVGARESKTGRTGTATQWVEIPDLTRRKLTLGSLLLGVKSLQTSAKPEDTQIQFSVDHNFARPLQLNFMSFIYNAVRAENGEMNLATKIEIFDAQGRAVVNTPMRPLSTKGLEDSARIPFSGEIKQQTSVPGNYLLRVTVNDLAAKTTVVQQTVFKIE
jgi:VWFA-related protein